MLVFKRIKIVVSYNLTDKSTTMSTDFFLIAKSVFAGLASVSALAIGAFWKYQNKIVYSPQQGLMGKNDGDTLGPRQPSDLELYSYQDVCISLQSG